jgi:hypothetical protein
MSQRVEILIRENDQLVEQQRGAHKEIDKLRRIADQQAEESTKFFGA